MIVIRDKATHKIKSITTNSMFPFGHIPGIEATESEVMEIIKDGTEQATMAHNERKNDIENDPSIIKAKQDRQKKKMVDELREEFIDELIKSNIVKADPKLAEIAGYIADLKKQ